jgi:hypothetical protein
MALGMGEGAHGPSLRIEPCFREALGEGSTLFLASVIGAWLITSTADGIREQAGERPRDVNSLGAAIGRGGFERGDLPAMLVCTRGKRS